MRIISGFLRGRLITIPKNCTIRPTSEKLRGAVFNIAQGMIQNAKVLDLCCGSGAIGIEAISRGCASCTFVDADRTVLSHLKTNLQNLGITHQASLIHQEMNKALKSNLLQGKQFSLVYIDPPYDLTQMLPETLQLLTERSVLAPGALIFLEVRKNSFSPNTPSSLILLSKRTYSESDLFEFRLSNP